SRVICCSGTGVGDGPGQISLCFGGVYGMHAPVVLVSAPGKLIKRLLKLRFSCSMTMTCWIFEVGGGVGVGPADPVGRGAVEVLRFELQPLAAMTARATKVRKRFTSCPPRVSGLLLRRCAPLLGMDVVFACFGPFPRKRRKSDRGYCTKGTLQSQVFTRKEKWRCVISPRRWQS